MLLTSRGETSLEWVWKRYLKVVEKLWIIFLQNCGHSWLLEQNVKVELDYQAS